MIVRLAEIPAYSEACGLRPTARISKPRVVFLEHEPNDRNGNDGKENTNIHP